MWGFLIGLLCLIALIRVLRRGRSCRSGGCGGRWGRHRDRGYGGGGYDGDHHGDGFLRAILEQLDASPEQEKVIRSAVSEVRDAGRAAKDEVKKSRSEVAKAVRGPHVDEVFFGELFARHDVAIENIRRAAVGAVARIHDALDDKQRSRLADLIEEGPRAFFRRGFR